MSAQFRILGDLEVCIDDQVVDVGHTRQRCVLVALLVDANHPVPVDRLIDRVWADQPPVRPRGALYNYLSRLRHLLSAADDVHIARRTGGYVLEVDPLAVDLHRFRHLIARASVAGNDSDALVLLERALGLWRGEVLDGIDTPWLNSVRDRLDRERLAVELDRNDLALRQGHHARLLADLTSAAAVHSLDERLTGQLMLALYRNGRQAEALTLFEQSRHRLADEVGVDPSPALRDLHQKILTNDSQLTVPAIRPAHRPVGRLTPRRLPVPNCSFTGRTRELALLDALLPGVSEQSAAAVIAAVSGAPGVGKTSLVVHWAHRVARLFPDGQLYLDLRGSDPAASIMAPAEAVRWLLQALDVPWQRIPVESDAQAALYRSLLADKHMLIVLDNARDATQVRPMLPGTPTCLVVVTSRDPLTGLLIDDKAHPIILDRLSTSDAREMLTRRLGPDRLAAEPAAAEQISARCARLPLALAIAAAQTATRTQLSLTAFADELRHAHDRLGVQVGDDLRAVFSCAYGALATAAARVFRLLSLHPGPDFTAPVVASLAAVPTRRARLLLAELTCANLIVEHVPGRFVLHDLIRAYAREQAGAVDSAPDRHSAQRRLLDHYLHTAHTAARLLSPSFDQLAPSAPQRGASPEQPSDYQQATAWFTAEHTALLIAINQVSGAGFDTHVCQLARVLEVFLDKRGHWHDLLVVGHAALAAAGRLADTAEQARAHRSLSRAYMQLDRFDEAQTHARQAVEHHRRSDDPVGLAHSYYSLSCLLEWQDHLTESLDYTRRALDLYAAAGHRQGLADALNGVGWLLTLMGDHQQAIVHCRQAVVLRQELGDRIGEAAAWDSIGLAHHNLGEWNEAITSYQHALHQVRAFGDQYYEAVTLVHLGDTHQAVGDADAARDAWHSASAILDCLNHADADAVHEKLRCLDRTRE